MKYLRPTSLMRVAGAILVICSSLVFSSAAYAQTCAYNSTQGTCACPTTGGGTTCFGGLLYRSSDSTCQADSRPCTSTQIYNCSTLACACNTAAYPCGGCTAASSTIGANCGAPTNGKYVDQCGACSCPVGSTICTSSNTCVANRVCPTGSTWNVCTDTCDNPYVLVSPGSVQTGFINVTGDIKSTGGDAYLSNGKAIRVDGSGATTLNVGNWGGGATGFNMGIFGNIGLGTSTPSAKLDVIGNVRVANGGTSTLTIRREAPATDLASIAFDSAGTSQWSFGLRNSSSNDLYWRDNLNGLTLMSLMQGTGNLGVGTTTPAAKLDVVGTAKMTGLLLPTGAGANKVLTSDASGNGTWQSVATSGAVTGTGTTNYHSKFTAAGVLGNSIVFDDGTNVGVGTATPTTKIDVNGTAKVLGFLLPTGAAVGKVLTSDASGNGTWVSPATAPVTSVSGSGAGISVSPTTGAVSVSNTGVTSAVAGTGMGVSAATGAVTFSNTGVTSLTAGTGISLSAATGAVTVTATGAVTGSGTTNYVPKFTSATSVGNSQLFDSGTNIGVGTASPASKLDIVGNVHSSAEAGFGWSPQVGTAVTAIGSSTGVEGGGTSFGVRGWSTNGFGMFGDSDNGYGVYGISRVGSGYGVYGAGNGSASAGVYGTVGNASGSGVEGLGGLTGVKGSGTSYGVYGSSPTTGVYGTSANVAVRGVGGTYGVQGNGSTGVIGNGTGTGVYGSGATTGGYFQQNNLSATAWLADSIGGGRGIATWAPYQAGAFYNSSYGTQALVGTSTTGVAATGASTGVSGSGSSYGVYGTGGTYGVLGTGTYAGVYGSGPYSFMGSGTLYNSGNANITGTIDSNYYQSEWNGHAWNGGSYGPYFTGVSTQTVMCFTHMVHIWGQGGKRDIWQSGGYWYFGVWSWASSSDVYCAFSCFKYK